MSEESATGGHAAYLRTKRSVISVVLAKYQQRSTRVPETLFCFLEGAVDFVAYRGSIDKHLPNAQPFPIVCEGKVGVLTAFGRLLGDKGDDLTNCLFFVDRDYDEHLGRAVPADWRMFVTDGYSFESDYAFGPGMDVLVRNVLAVHWDLRETNIFMKRFVSVRAQFSNDLCTLLGVALYCRSQGCHVAFEKTKVSQLFNFKEDGTPERKREALGLFLQRSLESGEVASIWPARTYIKALRCSSHHLAIRGKYALEYLRICVDRLMHALQEKGVMFVRVDTGERNFAQLLAAHIELTGLPDFLAAAKPRLSVPC